MDSMRFLTTKDPFRAALMLKIAERAIVLRHEDQASRVLKPFEKE